MKKTNMNKRIFLLGSLSVLAITAVTFVDFSAQGVYKVRNQQPENAPGIEGAFDVYNKLKGDYTHEDWVRAREQAMTMPQDRTTVSWLDQGPDNVGGRTRAILVDKNDVNHVYAGSGSGGLFESFNRANEWQQVTTFESNVGISSMCQTTDGVLYVATGHSQETTGGSQNAYDSGHNGDGIFKKNTDGTFTQIPGTTSNGTGASDFDFVNEIVCDILDNEVWIACSGGLKKYSASTGVLTDVTGNGITSGSCLALSISPDGQVIVASMAGGKTNVSVDYGATFEDRSGNGAGEIEPGAARVEYAISHEKNSNGKYNVYASCGGSMHLVGIWRSTDNGITWTEIAPAGNGAPGTFSPFSHSTTSGQAAYDNTISVQRGNPDRILMGGIDIYSWNYNGNWTQLTQWFYPPQNPQYAHADQHEQVWDKLGRLYVGNDGGVGYSDDGGLTFVPANRGYNVTQFYAIGFSAHGDVIGGAQDNGTQANYHDNATWRSHDEVGGGDGFSATISFINRNILFSSVYHGSVSRSSDRGQTSNPFNPSDWTCDPGGLEAGCGQFFTNFELWENPKDLNSDDSIDFIPTQAYDAGDEVLVPSKTSQKNIKYITPSALIFDDTLAFNPALTGFDTIIVTSNDEYNLSVLEHILHYNAAPGAPPIAPNDSIRFPTLNDTIVKVLDTILIAHYYGTNPLAPGDIFDMGNEPEAYNVAWDTIRVQDYFQSWFAIGLGGSVSADGSSGVWMTRNALRLSSNANEWFKVAEGIGEVSTMEFSHDGNNLFIGTWSGQLYRLSDFGDVYSPKKVDGGGSLADTLIDWDAGHYATTLTLINTFGGPVTGIAVDGDVDHVAVTIGNFGTSPKVLESTNASGGSPTFTSIFGDLPNMPYYSIVIDRDNPNTILVGGEFGVYITENAGSGNDWVNCSGPIGNTPVYDMGQNWRTWDEGCYRPGEIYVGTHGRGIFSSDAFLSLPGDQDNLAPDKFIPNIKIYPNPVNEVGNLEFALEENADAYLQIFNLNGQLVQEVSKSNLMAGNNIITFNTSDLPRGTYVVRLTAGSMVETTKFVKH
ncbi:MAG: T9SS type A sorting domain-containing protein [Crocinitomicaceae bacterium]|nr:T9SS type A sorting domain-containing protein [Crocinitomicaceae bacterium]